MNSPVNRSLIPRALWEYVVIADTHYMRDPGARVLEFESRRQQTARAGAALQLVRALAPDFVVHMGDLVQEYPDTAEFETALDEALAQLAPAGQEFHFVAGNHDVGDKPDPTMPVHPVTPASLAAFERRYGRPYYHFDRGPVRYVVLNAQLLNTSLPEARQQQRWLDGLLSECQATRCVLFLHMPPYLTAADEPHLGHYDNLGEPARQWLLSWIDRAKPELVFAAHVHFGFYDRRGLTRMVTVPSTSFTRPGFGHLFTAGPPPEQGRDDTPKLGFYWCRVLPQRTELHWIRTGGITELPPQTRLITPIRTAGCQARHSLPAGRRRADAMPHSGPRMAESGSARASVPAAERVPVSGTKRSADVDAGEPAAGRNARSPAEPSPSGPAVANTQEEPQEPAASALVPQARGAATERLPDSYPGEPHLSLGVGLAHPLANFASVPVAWPSVVRQPVRNDYPLLACLELGVDRVRIPWSDLLDRQQRERLQLLVDEGVRIQAFVPVDAHTNLHPGLRLAAEWGVDVEIQLAGCRVPDGPALDWLHFIARNCPALRITVTPVLPGERLPGKQHPRTRTGFLPEELTALDRVLVDADLQIAAALCRLDMPRPWSCALQLAQLPGLQAVQGVQGLVSLPGCNASVNTRLAAEARVAIMLLDNACLWIEPLVDLDRTMDVRYGLLDTLCNPRPTFHALRCAHALLKAREHVCQRPWSSAELGKASEPEILALTNHQCRLGLLLPRPGTSAPVRLPPEQLEGADMVCELATGRCVDPDSPGQCTGPLLALSDPERGRSAR